MLPLIAIGIVFLMGSVAFAVDLGWVYFNGKEAQKAADAAALAGVVHMPADFPLATGAALQLAKENGYLDTSMGGDATVTPEPVPGQERQLKVTVSRPVDTFFLRVFGWDTFTVTKDATAQYVLPLAMGSPLNRFGNDPTSGFNAGFWAAIQAPYTKKEHGDPFATRCDLSDDDEAPCQTSNSEYRPEGYFYAVDVPPGATNVRIQLYDAGFYHGSVAADPGDFRWSEGSACPGCEESGSEGHAKGGATMVYTLHDVDGTPFVHTDNPPISPAQCSTGQGAVTLSPQDSSPDTQDRWFTLCSLGSPAPGIYPIQVQTVGTGHAMSMFSIRAISGSGPQPGVYGIGDMSIWSNVPSGQASFFLAEVEELHAGKLLVLRFFDPGDAQGTNFINIFDPTGGSPACRVEVPADGIDRIASPCRIDATRTRTVEGFNHDWLTVSFELPSSYSCDSQPYPAGNGCWWKATYTYSAGNVNDRTTWTANIIGDPIRLVE